MKCLLVLSGILILLSTLCLQRNEAQQVACPAKKLCGNEYTPGFVEEYCREHDWELDGRCCYNSSLHGFERIVGLNLESCGITSLKGVLLNYTNLHVLSLLNNSIDNMTKDDFEGLTHIEILYIPETQLCPGGKKAWENIVSETYGRKCVDERDPCVYLNVSCTDAGDCHHLGPGMAKCQCFDGFYGYKCLRNGNFPYTFFALMTGIPTVTLSLLLWCTQRRHAKTD